jgi:hypothetical protein
MVPSQVPVPGGQDLEVVAVQVHGVVCKGIDYRQSCGPRWSCLDLYTFHTGSKLSLPWATHSIIASL